MKKKIEEAKNTNDNAKRKIGGGEKLLKRIKERTKRVRRSAEKLDVVSCKLKRARKMSQSKKPDIHKTLLAILDSADAVGKSVKRYEEVLAQLNLLVDAQRDEIQDLKMGLLADTQWFHKVILKGDVFASLNSSIRIPGEEPIGGVTFYDSPFFNPR